MSRTNIENLIAGLPYEVNAIFDDEGNLVSINSTGSSGSAGYAKAAMDAIGYMKSRPDYDGQLTSFHNHPLGSSAIGMFSESDVLTFAANADALKRGFRGYPSVGTVKTSDGRTYTLEYVGGGRRSTSNFSKAYGSALAYGEREASRENARRSRNGGSPMTSRQFADMVDSVAEGWLAENARHYGFRFIQGRWR